MSTRTDFKYWARRLVWIRIAFLVLISFYSFLFFFTIKEHFYCSCTAQLLHMLIVLAQLSFCACISASMQQTQKCKFNSKKIIGVGGNGPISSQYLVSYNYHQGEKNGLNDLHLFDYIWYLNRWVVIYATNNWVESHFEVTYQIV